MSSTGFLNCTICKYDVLEKGVTCKRCNQCLNEVCIGITGRDSQKSHSILTNSYIFFYCPACKPIVENLLQTDALKDALNSTPCKPPLPLNVNNTAQAYPSGIARSPAPYAHASPSGIARSPAPFLSVSPVNRPSVPPPPPPVTRIEKASNKPHNNNIITKNRFTALQDEVVDSPSQNRRSNHSSWQSLAIEYECSGLCVSCIKCHGCGGSNVVRWIEFGIEKESEDASDELEVFPLMRPFCARCLKLRASKNFCPICEGCYEDDDYDATMIECAQCNEWVHSQCEGMTEEDYQILSFLPDSVEFICNLCLKTEKPEWKEAIRTELQAGLDDIISKVTSLKSSQHIMMVKKSPSKSDTFTKKSECCDRNKDMDNKYSLIHDLSKNCVQSSVSDCCSSLTSAFDCKYSEMNKNVELSEKGYMKLDTKQSIKNKFLYDENQCDNKNLSVVAKVSKDIDDDCLSSEESDYTDSDTEIESIIDDLESSRDLTDIKSNVAGKRYKSVLQFHVDILRVIEIGRKLNEIQSNDTERRYMEILKERFSWFQVDKVDIFSLVDVVNPFPMPSIDHNYSDGSNLYQNFECFKGAHSYNSPKETVFQLSSPSRFPFTNLENSANNFRINGESSAIENNKSTAISTLYKKQVEIDKRKCVLCNKSGDADSKEQGRLLYLGQDEWLHVNCALWSSEVYEEENGSLQNVYAAVSRGRQIKCSFCSEKGATIGCCHKNCGMAYHFICAKKSKAFFVQGQTIFCRAHGCNKESLKLIDDLRVARCVFVAMDTEKRKWKPVTKEKINVAIGSLRITNLGNMSPNIDATEALIPIDFSCTRIYWSTKNPMKRVKYFCRTKIVDPEVMFEKPQDFHKTIDHSWDSDLVQKELDKISDWHNQLKLAELARLSQQTNIIHPLMCPLYTEILNEQMKKRLKKNIVKSVCRQLNFESNKTDGMSSEIYNNSMLTSYENNYFKTFIANNLDTTIYFTGEFIKSIMIELESCHEIAVDIPKVNEYSEPNDTMLQDQNEKTRKIDSEVRNKKSEDHVLENNASDITGSTNSFLKCDENLAPTPEQLSDLSNEKKVNEVDSSEAKRSNIFEESFRSRKKEFNTPVKLKELKVVLPQFNHFDKSFSENKSTIDEESEVNENAILAKKQLIFSKSKSNVKENAVNENANLAKKQSLTFLKRKSNVNDENRSLAKKSDTFSKSKSNVNEENAVKENANLAKKQLRFPKRKANVNEENINLAKKSDTFSKSKSNVNKENANLAKKQLTFPKKKSNVNEENAGNENANLAKKSDTFSEKKSTVNKENVINGNTKFKECTSLYNQKNVQIVPVENQENEITWKKLFHELKVKKETEVFVPPPSPKKFLSLTKRNSKNDTTNKTRVSKPDPLNKLSKKNKHDVPDLFLKKLNTVEKSLNPTCDCDRKTPNKEIVNTPVKLKELKVILSQVNHVNKPDIFAETKSTGEEETVVDQSVNININSESIKSTESLKNVTELKNLKVEKSNNSELKKLKVVLSPIRKQHLRRCKLGKPVKLFPFQNGENKNESNKKICMVRPIVKLDKQEPISSNLSKESKNGQCIKKRRGSNRKPAFKRKKLQMRRNYKTVIKKYPLRNAIKKNTPIETVQIEINETIELPSDEEKYCLRSIKRKWSSGVLTKNSDEESTLAKKFKNNSDSEKSEITSFSYDDNDAATDVSSKSLEAESRRSTTRRVVKFRDSRSAITVSIVDENLPKRLKRHKMLLQVDGAADESSSDENDSVTITKAPNLANRIKLQSLARSTAGDEGPFKCAKCRRLYRTKESFTRHTESCTFEVDSSSSSSENSNEFELFRQPLTEKQKPFDKNVELFTNSSIKSEPGLGSNQRNAISPKDSRTIQQHGTGKFLKTPNISTRFTENVVKSESFIETTPENYEECTSLYNQKNVEIVPVENQENEITWKKLFHELKVKKETEVFVPPPSPKKFSSLTKRSPNSRKYSSLRVVKSSKGYQYRRIQSQSKNYSAINSPVQNSQTCSLETHSVPPQPSQVNSTPIITPNQHFHSYNSFVSQFQDPLAPSPSVAVPQGYTLHYVGSFSENEIASSNILNYPTPQPVVNPSPTRIIMTSQTDINSAPTPIILPPQPAINSSSTPILLPPQTQPQVIMTPQFVNTNITYTVGTPETVLINQQTQMTPVAPMQYVPQPIQRVQPQPFYNQLTPLVHSVPAALTYNQPQIQTATINDIEITPIKTLPIMSTQVFNETQNDFSSTISPRCRLQAHIAPTVLETSNETRSLKIDSSSSYSRPLFSQTSVNRSVATVAPAFNTFTPPKDISTSIKFIDKSSKLIKKATMASSTPKSIPGEDDLKNNQYEEIKYQRIFETVLNNTKVSPEFNNENENIENDENFYKLLVKKGNSSGSKFNLLPVKVPETKIQAPEVKELRIKAKVSVGPKRKKNTALSSDHHFERVGKDLFLASKDITNDLFVNDMNPNLSLDFSPRPTSADDTNLVDKTNASRTQPRIIFELTSEDGFKIESHHVAEVWSKVFQAVSEARDNLRFSSKFGASHHSSDSLSGLPMLGLTHSAVQYLLEQLPGAKDCHKYSFQFHRRPTDEVLRETASGCARSEPFKTRKPYDIFSWLASKHRKLPLKARTQHDDVQLSVRRATSLELPMAMRYRHLSENSREAVGVFRSSIHGRGLFCKREIDAGEMVIEYAGQAIRSCLCDSREKYYESKGIGCYMFRIDEETVIDATLHGNAARFINHSCEPNCFSRVVDILGHKHIIIFALRRIERGEELTYDYKFPIEDDKIPCSCSYKRCRKYLN